MQSLGNIPKSKLAFASSFLLLAIVVIGWVALTVTTSERQTSTTPTANPTTAARPAPQEAVSPTSTPQFPTPVVYEVWKPLEPKKLYAAPTATPITDSPDAMLAYEMAGLGTGLVLKVTRDGLVAMNGFFAHFTYQLSPGELAHIKNQIKAADFFKLADEYREEDPPGWDIDMPIVTITYKEPGRSKSVILRGTKETPPALLDLQTNLENLAFTIRDKGTPEPSPSLLVDYFMWSNPMHDPGHVWSFSIAEDGSLYYGSGHEDARLTPHELKTLRDMLNNINYIGSDEKYYPPKTLDPPVFVGTDEAIISTYANGHEKQRVDTMSGAEIPRELQILLDKLAEIFDKYVPRQ